MKTLSRAAVVSLVVVALGTVQVKCQPEPKDEAWRAILAAPGYEEWLSEFELEGVKKEDVMIRPATSCETSYIGFDNLTKKCLADDKIKDGGSLRGVQFRIHGTYFYAHFEHIKSLNFSNFFPALSTEKDFEDNYYFMVDFWISEACLKDKWCLFASYLDVELRNSQQSSKNCQQASSPYKGWCIFLLLALAATIIAFAIYVRCPLPCCKKEQKPQQGQPRPTPTFEAQVLNDDNQVQDVHHYYGEEGEHHYEGGEKPQQEEPQYEGE